MRIHTPLGYTLVALIAAPASAQWTLERSLIGAGGGVSTEGIFSSSWSLGQAVVGETASAPLSLEAGFWTPNVARCHADFNADGFLDFFDYDDFVACFESGNCPPGTSGDFNGDGFADFFDYDDFVAAFEAGC